MAFHPVNFEEGHLVKLPMGNGGSSASYTVGQALKISSGYYVAATVGQNTDVEAVCMEAGTVSTSGTLLLCLPTRGVKFVALCNTTPVQDDVGTYCDLTDSNTLDESTSADDLFYIEDIYSTTDKKVLGYFNHGVPNS
jgi:hypothetical protein